MTTYVLGAGPAGMAVVDGLVDAKGGDFVILDKAPQVGGLAQTLHWEKIGSHDLGPHKIFSLDHDLISRVENLLQPADWLTRDKVSSIFMNGHYLPYPPSPFALSGVFGLFAFSKMVMGYGLALLSSLFRKTAPRTFEEDLVGRMGAPLYSVLFKPIAEKLWGNPKELDVKLSLGRVQTPSLIEIIGRLLKLKNNSEFEALTFRYPKKGLGQIWSAIEKKAKGSGQFLLGHNVTRLVTNNERVSEIHYQSADGEGVIHVGVNDDVVSTLPLTLATTLLSGSLPSHIPDMAKNVIGLNDLLLVFVHVAQKSLIKESWIFIPDPKIIFHRLSEQESFDPEMTPNGSIVCCEIMSGKDRLLTGLTDEELCKEAIQGLNSMGYKDFNVLSKRVIRLPKSYPVFRTGFETGLAEIIQTLDKFENFRTVGRQGAFNYIGTLDAMDIGYGVAKWLAEGKKVPWQQERERTNHYPVLD